MTLRIIAGTHRGRALLSPSGKEIRPTTGKTREAMFNLLLHGFEASPIIEQKILDLCCGTGALGLEALSRGAAHVTFIDQDANSLDLAKENARRLGEWDRCRFLQGSATQLPQASEPVSCVIMDAPYRSGLMQGAYISLRNRGWAAAGTIIAFEHAAKEPLPPLEQCEIVKERLYGKTRVSIVRCE